MFFAICVLYLLVKNSFRSIPVRSYANGRIGHMGLTIELCAAPTSGMWVLATLCQTALCSALSTARTFTKFRHLKTNCGICPTARILRVLFQPLFPIGAFDLKLT
jgi:hypothetical protein